MREVLSAQPGDFSAVLRRSSGDVVGPLFVAERAATRARGLLGRHTFDAAILIRPCMSVHTFGMSMTLDVAFLDRRGTVIDMISPLRPNRLTRPRRRARAVLECAEGGLARWGVGVGDVLIVDTTTEPNAADPVPGPGDGIGDGTDAGSPTSSRP